MKLIAVGNPFCTATTGWGRPSWSGARATDAFPGAELIDAGHRRPVADRPLDADDELHVIVDAARMGRGTGPRRRASAPGEVSLGLAAATGLSLHGFGLARPSPWPSASTACRGDLKVVVGVEPAQTSGDRDRGLSDAVASAVPRGAGDLIKAEVHCAMSEADHPGH
jgi:hypothetical protein